MLLFLLVRGGFIVIANLRKHYCVFNINEKNSAISMLLSHNKGQEGNPVGNVKPI